MAISWRNKSELQTRSDSLSTGNTICSAVSKDSILGKKYNKTGGQHIAERQSIKYINATTYSRRENGDLIRIHMRVR